MKRDVIWTNADGLAVGFGTREVESNSGAAVAVSDGLKKQVVVQIKGTGLPDSDVSAQLLNGVVIPANSYLLGATLFVTEAFTSGGSAVLDIGLYKRSDGTAVDDDGIDSAIAVATLVDNYDVACDGALIGTVLANNSVIGVSYDTAAFTAGEATLLVEYVVPAN
jgi:hypothetical protein